MDLGKMTNEHKLNLCRWYFRAGAAFLPFIWAVNAIWFFNEAFRKPEYEEQKQIKKYVIYSGIGAIIWLIVITTWVVIYQTHRVQWGEFGDDISFIIPLGS